MIPRTNFSISRNNHALNFEGRREMRRPSSGRFSTTVVSSVLRYSSKTHPPRDEEVQRVRECDLKSTRSQESPLSCADFGLHFAQHFVSVLCHLYSLCALLHDKPQNAEMLVQKLCLVGDSPEFSASKIRPTSRHQISRILLL